jgi:hypothetical protein
MARPVALQIPMRTRARPPCAPWFMLTLEQLGDRRLRRSYAGLSRAPLRQVRWPVEASKFHRYQPIRELLGRQPARRKAVELAPWPHTRTDTFARLWSLGTECCSQASRPPFRYTPGRLSQRPSMTLPLAPASHRSLHPASTCDPEGLIHYTLLHRADAKESPIFG